MDTGGCLHTEALQDIHQGKKMETCSQLLTLIPNTVPNTSESGGTFGGSSLSLQPPAHIAGAERISSKYTSPPKGLGDPSHACAIGGGVTVKPFPLPGWFPQASHCLCSP